MPRRNRRDRPAPLDLTPQREPKRPLPIARPHLPRQPIETQPRRTKAQVEAEQAERQRLARMQQGIDWSTCLVPGCGRSTLQFGVTPEERRDPLTELPLCDTHGVIAWKTVQFNKPSFAQAHREIDEIHTKRDAAATRRYVVRDQGGEGVIYFLRHNGLIKVGWTSDFYKRLRAYGPSTVVLCHYPGTRQDETNLHRQLRPSLAKGREWYHEDKRLTLFIDDAIQRYGEPRITDGGWTQPKADLAAKPRKRSA